MKKTLLILLICLWITMLAAAAEPALVLDDSEAQNQPVPYNLYPAPEGGYVGDVMPFVDGDELQLYYLYDTDHNGQGYHPIYRFSTDDLRSYRDDGLMLDYGTFDAPDLALGTGSVLKDRQRQYHMFYTGHNDAMGALGQGRECVMHAVSMDGDHWTKLSEDTFYAEDNFSKDDFRDPFVFWNEEDNSYWLLIAGRENELGGVIAKYTSEDLTEWTYDGVLYAPQAQYMLECPDLFKMGDRYYLFYSWDCVTYYAMSDSINGPFVAPEDNVLDGTGFVYYAAKTAEFKGKRYLCGWIGRAIQGKDVGIYRWAGNLLIHEMIQKEDGTLGVRAPESLYDYFTEVVNLDSVTTFGDVTQDSNRYILKGNPGGIAILDLGPRPPTMWLEFDLTIDGNGCAGLAFGTSEDYGIYNALAFDTVNQSIHYEGTKLAYIDEDEPIIQTHFAFEQGMSYHITVIAENEIVIVYINGTKVLSNRIFSSINGAHICLFAKDAVVTSEAMQLRIR